MSFDGTVASTYQQVCVNRRSASCGDESEKNSRSQCEEGRKTQQSQLTAKDAPRQGSNVSPSSQVIKSVFVRGVGWASQVRSAASAFCICCNVLSLRYFLFEIGKKHITMAIFKLPMSGRFQKKN